MTIISSNFGSTGSMKVYNGILYIGRDGLLGETAQVWKYDGNNLTLEYDTGRVDTPIYAMEVFNNELYVGVGYKTYKYNGSSWSSAGDVAGSHIIEDLKAFQNWIYALTSQGFVEDPHLWKSDGSGSWGAIGFTYCECHSAEVFDNKLWILTWEFEFKNSLWYTSNGTSYSIDFYKSERLGKKIYAYNNCLYFGGENGIIKRRRQGKWENIDEIIAYMISSFCKYKNYLYVVSFDPEILYEALYPEDILPYFSGQFLNLELGKNNYFNSNIPTSDIEMKLYYTKRWL